GVGSRIRSDPRALDRAGHVRRVLLQAPDRVPDGQERQAVRASRDGDPKCRRRGSRPCRRGSRAVSARSMMSTFRGHRIPHVDFMGRKKWWFALSGFFILLSLVGLFVRGLNFSLDFKGGTLLTFNETTGASVASLHDTLAKYGLKEPKW